MNDCMSIEIRPRGRTTMVTKGEGHWIWGPGGVRKLATAGEGLLLLGGDRVVTQGERFVLVEHALDGPAVHVVPQWRLDGEAQAIVRKTMNPVDLVRVRASSPLGAAGEVVGRTVPCWEADLLEAGIAAADEILEAFGLRVDVEKASKPLDPNKTRDFAKIVRQLTKDISDLPEREERAAIKRSLKGLQGVDWTEMDIGQRRKIMSGVEEALGRPLVHARSAPAVKKRVTVTGEQVIGGTKKSVSRDLKIDLQTSMNQMDQRIVDGIKGQSGHYLTDRRGYAATKVTERGLEAVEAGIADGLGSKEIADRLEAVMLEDENFGRNRAYAELCAQAWVQDARSYGQIAGYSEAGIQRYRIEAVLDEATTPICVGLHGKVFEVGTAMKAFEDRAGWDDPQEIKTAAPWIRLSGGEMFIKPPGGKRTSIATRGKDGAFKFSLSDQALQGKGIGPPPYHGFCRTTTVPEISSMATLPDTPVSAPEPTPTSGPAGMPEPTADRRSWVDVDRDWKTFLDKKIGKPKGPQRTHSKTRLKYKMLDQDQRTRLVDTVRDVIGDAGNSEAIESALDVGPWLRDGGNEAKEALPKIKAKLSRFFGKRFTDNGGRIKKVYFTWSKKRAKFLGGEIYVDGRVGKAIHEFGHHIEQSNPRAVQATMEFRDRRTKGESLVKLRKYHPNAGAKEVARVDKFVDPYVGRVYGDRLSTEVLSVGVEMFERVDSMVDLYQRDPEHFRLVMAILTGTA